MPHSLEEFLSVALLVPMGVEADPSNPNCIWGLPVVVEGPPGVGKSALVKATAAAVELEGRTIYCPTRSYEDFAGLPMPDADDPDGVRMVCPLPAIRQLKKAESGVCFLDEISGTPRAVQNALLGFVLDRAVGDLQLPPRVRILSAANGILEGGNYELIPPLANHFA